MVKIYKESQDFYHKTYYMIATPYIDLEDMRIKPVFVECMLNCIEVVFPLIGNRFQYQFSLAAA